jgi:hypothetical protein
MRKQKLKLSVKKLGVQKWEWIRDNWDYSKRASDNYAALYNAYPILENFYCGCSFCHAVENCVDCYLHEPDAKYCCHAFSDFYAAVAGKNCKAGRVAAVSMLKRIRACRDNIFMDEKFRLIKEGPFYGKTLVSIPLPSTSFTARRRTPALLSFSNKPLKQK